MKLFRREIREKIENTTKAVKDKVFKKVRPTLLPRHSLLRRLTRKNVTTVHGQRYSKAGYQTS